MKDDVIAKESTDNTKVDTGAKLDATPDQASLLAEAFHASAADADAPIINTAITSGTREVKDKEKRREKTFRAAQYSMAMYNLSAQKQKLMQLKDRHGELSFRHEELATQIEQAREQITLHHENVAGLNSQLETIQDQLRELVQNKAGIKQELDDRQDAYSDAYLDYENVESEIIHELGFEGHPSQTTYPDIQVNDEGSYFIVVGEETRYLTPDQQARLQQADQEMNDAYAAYTETLDQLLDIEDTIKSVKEEQAELKDALQHEIAELEAQKEELGRLEEEMEALEMQIATLEAEIEQTENIINKMERDANTLSERAEGLKDKDNLAQLIEHNRKDSTAKDAEDPQTAKTDNDSWLDHITGDMSFDYLDDLFEDTAQDTKDAPTQTTARTTSHAGSDIKAPCSLKEAHQAALARTEDSLHPQTPVQDYDHQQTQQAFKVVI